MDKSPPSNEQTTGYDADRLQVRTSTAVDNADSANAHDPLLTTRESAKYLNVSKSYLDKFRVYGGGPEFLRPSPRKILYRQSALDSWVHERRFSSTSEYQR